MAIEWQAPFTQERVRLLDELGRALTGAVDLESTVRIAARFAVPGLADLVVVAVREDGLQERLEVAHVDPGKEAPIADLVRPALPALTRAGTRDFQQGRHFRWIPTITEASTRFLGSQPELHKLLGVLEIRSLMTVPLRSSGRILGGIGFARLGEKSPFHAADLAVAQVIARRAAVAIERAELHESIRDEEGRRARLEDALQKWIRVFDLAGWGAAVVDGSDRRIDAVNPAFARLHGYASPDSLTGRLFTDLLPPDRSSEPAQWLTQPEGRLEPYESLHLRTDGAAFPVLTDVTALETGAGVTSYVVTVQDVSDLKRAEERLRLAQRMEAVGRLAGGVAHEVNNMMTIVLGFGDLLAAAENLPDDRRRDVEEIQRAAKRAVGITQQLLAFSRQQLLQPAELRLNDAVTEMASVLRLLLPAHVQVETTLSPSPVTVRADRAQLDQVIINLAFNARDAMPDGGTISLGTSCRHFDAEDGRQLIGIPILAGHYACLLVSDTGHGMDPVALAHLFEPFFTTKPVGSGTGLGLATVYGIVKQSGGFLWVDSNPGGGTAFTVCLPLVERPAEEAEEDVSAAQVFPVRESATVLVVEDEDGVRELTRRVLEGAGFQVVDVRSGTDAMAVLVSSEHEIDVVLSDVVVPDMAASEPERRARERRLTVPFVYMSGYSREDVVAHGSVQSDRPFLQKPFTPAQLVKLVWSQISAPAAPVVGR